MAEFLVAGNYDTLFYGSDFYGEARLTATRDELKNTFTVSVTGARAWSKYGLNKSISFSCWLATDSDGSGRDSGSCTIPASGSGSHTGWNPSSGYTSVTGCSKTFDANSSTGACPTVYLYFKFDTGSVWYVNKEKYVSAQSTYSANISSTVQSKAGGANDRSRPSFVDGYPDVWPVSATSAGYKVKVSTGGSTYSLVVNNTTAQTSDSKGGCKNNTEISGSIETKSEVNSITFTCTKDNNGLSSTSDPLSVDCSKPNITFSIIPTGLNTADGHIKCSNYAFKYQVDKGSFSSNSTPKNTDAIYKFTNLRNIKETHTAKTRRSDVNIDSSEASYEVDMRLPTITNTSIVANTTTSGILTYKCDLLGTAYWYDNLGNELASWEVDSTGILSQNVPMVSNEVGNVLYTLKITRRDYPVLYSEAYTYGNTQTNTAEISSIDAAGTSMTVYLDIRGSIKGTPSARLYNAQDYPLTNTNNKPVNGALQSDGKYKFEFKNVPINIPMSMQLTVTNANSGVNSIIKLDNKGLICKGVVYVCTQGVNEEQGIYTPVWKMGVVYVNTNGTYKGWKGAAPYVNTHNGWQFGKVYKVGE